MKDIFALSGGMMTNETIYNYLKNDGGQAQHQRAATYPNYYYATHDLPMSRPGQRRTKRLVPDSEKDDRYWEKRKRNNEAARRSRENKRRLDLNIRQTVVLIEDENNLLRKELTIIKEKFGLPSNQRYLSINDSGDLIGTPVASSYLLPAESILSMFDEVIVPTHSNISSSSSSSSSGHSNANSSSNSGSANEMEDQPSPSDGHVRAREESPEGREATQEVSIPPKEPTPVPKFSSRHSVSDLQMPVKKRRYERFEKDEEETDESTSSSNPLSQSSSPEQRTSPMSFNHSHTAAYPHVALWPAGAQHHFASTHAQMQLRLHHQQQQQQQQQQQIQQRVANKDHPSHDPTLVSSYTHPHHLSAHHIVLDTVRNFPGYAFQPHTLPHVYGGAQTTESVDIATQREISHSDVTNGSECPRTRAEPEVSHEGHDFRSQSSRVAAYSHGDSPKGNKVGMELASFSSRDNDDIRSQLLQLTAEIQRMKSLVIKDGGLRHDDSSLRIASPPVEIAAKR